MAKIYGNTVGATGGLPKSFLLETEDGVQLVGVTVGEETVFDATPNDVREGKTYAGDDGVKIGEKIIPSYNTTEGIVLAPVGSDCSIQLQEQDKYDYTKFQAIICSFNSSISNSVAADMVSINDSVYKSNSTTVLATVEKREADKRIALGIKNETTKPLIIRYFTYKEIY